MELKNLGAQGIILGCTEIPIALPQSQLYDIPLIDPVQILAKQMIHTAQTLTSKM